MRHCTCVLYHVGQRGQSNTSHMDLRTFHIPYIRNILLVMRMRFGHRDTVTCPTWVSEPLQPQYIGVISPNN